MKEDNEIRKYDCTKMTADRFAWQKMKYCQNKLKSLLIFSKELLQFYLPKEIQKIHQEAPKVLQKNF